LLNSIILRNFIVCRLWLFLAACNGLIAVAAGAFGAHALKARLTADKLAVFEVAVRYQMYHAFALAVLSWCAAHQPSRRVTASGCCTMCGILLFSGSLYGLVFTNWKWLGPVTPVGGIFLMAGWLLLILAALHREPDRR